MFVVVRYSPHVLRPVTHAYFLLSFFLPADEFNRIDIEVLSVIASQVLCIQKAKRARVPKFVFEGSTISLDPAVGVFITMNPGYAGEGYGYKLMCCVIIAVAFLPNCFYGTPFSTLLRPSCAV